jgi:cysteinyl-tRNA synthetase
MPLNFSEDVIRAAQSSLERIFLFGENLNFAIESANTDDRRDLDGLTQYHNRFKEALFDDFNSAAAVSVLFDLIKDVNIKISGGAAGRKYLETVKKLYGEFCGLFGFIPEKKNSDVSDEYILEQINARIAAKKDRDFKTADNIRDNLKSQGIILEDTPSGTKWRRE